MTAILVIGARGMLGREVCRAAAARGFDVVRAGRAPTAGWITFDAERDDPERLFQQEVTLAVNCAAILAADLELDDAAALASAERVNARFPHELTDAATAAGARVVHISTDGVFAADAGGCSEVDTRFSDDPYGATKRRGEPTGTNALTLRSSLIGCDPTRRRGLLEWLLAQRDGSQVLGFTDQLWNGIVASQLADLCMALADASLFTRARAEGAIHHVFEPPTLTKFDLLELCRAAFGKRVQLVATESGQPVSRTLTTVHSTIRECLESRPRRTAALRELAGRGPSGGEDGS